MTRKRKMCAALLALCLMLVGCARRETDWQFTLDTRRDADDYTARDGTLLAWYSYELPRLGLEGGEPPAAAEEARDTFNAEMERQRTLLLEEYEQMRQLAVGDYIDRTEAAREQFRPSGNSLKVTHTYRTSRLLSVRAGGEAGWGAARPIPFTRTWNFDLKGGRFITWQDLTDDTDALRAVLAGQVLAQMAERDADWFDDSAATVERLEGCAVYLGADGLTLIFDEQLLAPRGAGQPEFTVEYEKLVRYFNAFGRGLIKE